MNGILSLFIWLNPFLPQFLTWYHRFWYFNSRKPKWNQDHWSIKMIRIPFNDESFPFGDPWIQFNSSELEHTKSWNQICIKYERLSRRTLPVAIRERTICDWDRVRSKPVQLAISSFSGTKQISGRWILSKLLEIFTVLEGSEIYHLFAVSWVIDISWCPCQKRPVSQRVIIPPIHSILPRTARIAMAARFFHRYSLAEGTYFWFAVKSMYLLFCKHNPTM